MKLKSIFSILLMAGAFSTNAFAINYERVSCGQSTPDYALVNDCVNLINYIFPTTPLANAQTICKGKDFAFSKCVVDIHEKTKITLRNNGAPVVYLDDCPMLEEKIIKPATAAYICENGTSDEYTSCVAELFKQGGLPFYSSKQPNGVALCKNGWRKDLNACIIEKYQSGHYAGSQAAVECANSMGLSHLVSGTAAQANADSAAREAYNRAQAEKRAAEAKRQQEQSKKQSEQKKTPAPGPTSSGNVIEDLPTL